MPRADEILQCAQINGEAFKILLEELGGEMPEPLAKSIRHLYNLRYSLHLISDGVAQRVLLDLLADSDQIHDPLRGRLENLRDAVLAADIRETEQTYKLRDLIRGRNQP